MRWCTVGQSEFRIVLEHLWKFVKNPRCTFIHAYNVHFDTYILAPVFIYFLLDSGGGKGSYKAHAAQPTTGGFWILKLLLCKRGVTAKERTGLRRFFFKLSLIALIKQIKNKSRCTATAPVSPPTSLRNFPNGCQGHPWFYPPPNPHRKPNRVKQCSTRSNFYSNIGIGWQKMHKAVEAWKQKKIHK